MATSQLRNLYEVSALEENYTADELLLRIQDEDEDIQVGLEQLSALDSQIEDALNSASSENGAPSLESFSNVFPSLEAKKTGDMSAKNILKTIWNDYWTTRQRIVSGIRDRLKSQENNVKTYRRKLQKKAAKAKKKGVENSNGTFNASYVSMEKYWKYFGAERGSDWPSNPLKAVTEEFDDTSQYIKEVPKNVEKLLGDLIADVNGLKANDNILGKLESSRTDYLDWSFIFPRSMMVEQKKFLYSTFVIVLTGAKSYSYGDRMKFTDSKLCLGDKAQDIANAVLTYGSAIPVIGGVLKKVKTLTSVVRLAATPTFELKGQEVIEIIEYGDKYLDSALEGINILDRALSVNNKQMDNLYSALSNLEDSPEEGPDAKDSKLVIKYANSLSKIITSQYGKFVTRQIKMAKGIDYLVARTITHKQKN